MDRQPHSSGFDAEDFEDYVRAAPFRQLADQWGESPASLAHRYALSVSKVASVILGVKNTIELQECLQAERAGRLSADQMATIQSLFAT